MHSPIDTPIAFIGRIVGMRFTNRSQLYSTLVFMKWEAVFKTNLDILSTTKLSCNRPGSQLNVRVFCDEPAQPFTLHNKQSTSAV